MSRSIWAALAGRNYAENSRTRSQKEGREEEEELLCCSAEHRDEDSSVFFHLMKAGAAQWRTMAEGKGLNADENFLLVDLGGPPPPQTIKAELRFLISLSKPGHEKRAG